MTAVETIAHEDWCMDPSERNDDGTCFYCGSSPAEPDQHREAQTMTDLQADTLTEWGIRYPDGWVEVLPSEKHVDHRLRYARALGVAGPDKVSRRVSEWEPTP